MKDKQQIFCDKINYFKTQQAIEWWNDENFNPMKKSAILYKHGKAGRFHNKLNNEEIKEIWEMKNKQQLINDTNRIQW